MLALISPAKTLDFESVLPSHEPSQPDFLDEAEELIRVLRGKTREDLAELMNLSEKLADLNFRRYESWRRPFDEDNARAALFAFKGDVYTGFDLDRYGARELARAQKHLRILSGLYGLLRPLDLIQPYRLEMGTGLETARGRELYDFWGDRIRLAVEKALDASGSRELINLASQEYFRSVRGADLEARIVTPVFRDLKNGTYRVISFYAKRARGMMCDFLIAEGVDEAEGLKDFSGGGYRFAPKASEGNTWIFTRDEPA